MLCFDASTQPLKASTASPLLSHALLAALVDRITNLLTSLFHGCPYFLLSPFISTLTSKKGEGVRQ